MSVFNPETYAVRFWFEDGDDEESSRSVADVFGEHKIEPRIAAQMLFELVWPDIDYDDSAIVCVRDSKGELRKFECEAIRDVQFASRELK